MTKKEGLKVEDKKAKKEAKHFKTVAANRIVSQQSEHRKYLPYQVELGHLQMAWKTVQLMTQ